MERTKTTPEARQRILETADRLFYQDGIRAVGIDRIIAEAVGNQMLRLTASAKSTDFW